MYPSPPPAGGLASRASVGAKYPAPQPAAYDVCAVMIERMAPTAATSFTDIRARRRLGTAMAARVPTIARTRRSSMTVNPDDDPDCWRISMAWTALPGLVERCRSVTDDLRLGRAAREVPKEEWTPSAPPSKEATPSGKIRRKLLDGRRSGRRAILRDGHGGSALIDGAALVRTEVARTRTGRRGGSHEVG